MSKQFSNSSLKMAPTSDEWYDHAAIEWLSKNKQQILWGFLALFIGIIITYRFISAGNLNAERDFYEAQADFSLLQREANTFEEGEMQVTLQKLNAILQLHPELHAKYDGSIAQTLLIEQEASQAKEWAERNFKRIQFEPVDFYRSYAATSLMIGEGDYAQAATQAEALKEKMQAEGHQDFGEILSVFNSIRLAMLYQKLNQSEKELKAWEALQQTPMQEALITVNQLFKEGQFSLNQYIEERKNALK